MDWSKCVPSCTPDKLDTSFLVKLNELDLAFIRKTGHELVVNSAFRSVDYEKSKGRSGTSSHCLGLAVDFSCRTSFDRYWLLMLLHYFGFKRYGVYPSFIHVDIDYSRSNPCAFYSKG